MVDADQIAKATDRSLAEKLNAIKPLTWAKVTEALTGLKWHAHATFDDENYHSNEVGDFRIRLQEDFIGYRTGEGGIEPMPGYYVYPKGDGVVSIGEDEEVA